MEDLRSIIAECNFSFKKQWGQNFLTDTNLLRAIVADAGIDETTNVLEIGAGAGALTRALSERANKVLAYEIDKSLQSVLSRTLAGCENVEVVFRDFAKADLAEIEEEIGDYVVAANLPYYVTTPVVMRFVEDAKRCRGLTVMVQEEVAERFCAKEGTAEYGAVTAAIARKGACKIMRRVPREMFTPRPNVDSAVVKIDFTSGGFEVKDTRAYRETVRCAFLSRRKTFENNLMSALRVSRAEAKELLQTAGIADGARGETLSPQVFGKLSDLLFEKGMLK